MPLDAALSLGLFAAFAFAAVFAFVAFAFCKAFFAGVCTKLAFGLTLGLAALVTVPDVFALGLLLFSWAANFALSILKRPLRDAPARERLHGFTAIKVRNAGARL